MNQQPTKTKKSTTVGGTGRVNDQRTEILGRLAAIESELKHLPRRDELQREISRSKEELRGEMAAMQDGPKDEMYRAREEFWRAIAESNLKTISSSINQLREDIYGRLTWGAAALTVFITTIFTAIRYFLK